MVGKKRNRNMNKTKSFTRVAMLSGVIAAAFLFSACEDVRTEEYPSGKIRIQTTYVKDKKEGPEKEFYENGNVKREATYVNDRREGVVKEYYEDGTLELWSKDGKLLSTISIYELIGIPKDDVEFPHYSFLKTGNEGDFLLLFAYDNDGVLEDLVYKIHI
jgi:antitoxin component YwqK of YwqJK toxin-antitoxin module